MRFQMDADPDYQMSLDELAYFLSVCEKFDYKFKFIISGGEPLMWKNLKSGLKMLRDSKVCQNIVLYSNGINIQVVDEETISLCDTFRISRYQYNTSNINNIKSKFPQLVVVDRKQHWKVPLEPVENVFPEDCGLKNELFLYRGRVYFCPMCPPITIQQKLDIITSVEVNYETGFLEGLKQLEKDHKPTLCPCCTWNKKIRAKYCSIPNISSRLKAL